MLRLHITTHVFYVIFFLFLEDQRNDAIVTKLYTRIFFCYKYHKISIPPCTKIYIAYCPQPNIIQLHRLYCFSYSQVLLLWSWLLTSYMTWVGNLLCFILVKDYLNSNLILKTHIIYKLQELALLGFQHCLVVLFITQSLHALLEGGTHG